MPGLAGGISRSIRNGEIKKYLIQPVDLIGFLFVGRVAHKLVYYMVAAVPYAWCSFCAAAISPAGPTPHVLAAFVCVAGDGVSAGLFLEATIGMIGFWFLEVSSLLFVYMLFNFFLSGHMFPIDMLTPCRSASASRWRRRHLLPLQYLAYFPAAVFLGKITGAGLVRGLVIEVAWVVFFIVLCRWLFHLGAETLQRLWRLTTGSPFDHRLLTCIA